MTKRLFLAGLVLALTIGAAARRASARATTEAARACPEHGAGFVAVPGGGPACASAAACAATRRPAGAGAGESGVSTRTEGRLEVDARRPTDYGTGADLRPHRQRHRDRGRRVRPLTRAGASSVGTEGRRACGHCGTGRRSRQWLRWRSGWRPPRRRSRRSPGERRARKFARLGAPHDGLRHAHARCPLPRARVPAGTLVLVSAAGGGGPMDGPTAACRPGREVHAAVPVRRARDRPARRRGGERRAGSRSARGALTATSITLTAHPTPAFVTSSRRAASPKRGPGRCGLRTGER